MKSHDILLTKRFSTVCTESDNLFIYALEASFPNHKIFKIHFSNISFVAVPSHNLILWDREERVDKVQEEILESWEELKFNNDKLLLKFLPAIPSPYPSRPVKGTLGCSISHLQAVEHRRELFAEKESKASSHRKNFGQYDTPFWLAKHTISELLASYTPSKNQFFLDPMAGEGAYLEAAFHSWIISLCKANDVNHKNPAISGVRLRKLLTSNSRQVIVGIEIDPKRISELNKKFKSIFQVHGMPPRKVAYLSSFFKKSDLNFEHSFSKAIFIGNPCWDVIETSAAVRSRSSNKDKVKVDRSVFNLIEERDSILGDFKNVFSTQLPQSAVRNVYALALIHCMLTSRFQAPISFLLPKGILGDQATAEIRNFVRNQGAQVEIEEFKNKVCGARIFSAVDSRVQFCCLRIIPTPNGSNGLKVRSHESEFKESLPYVNISWNWISKNSGSSEQWLTFRTNKEAAVASKILKFPMLEKHDGLRFFAGSPGASSEKRVFEGRDIEPFRLRRAPTGATDKGNYLLVRKILPNGGRKLIAAPASAVGALSDSLLCVEATENVDEIYYISGVLNSSIGEFRLRLFQSNMNLNLWRLKEFQIPKFEKNNAVHRLIARTTRQLEKSSSTKLFEELNRLVSRLYGLTTDDLLILEHRVHSSSVGAA